MPDEKTRGLLRGLDVANKNLEYWESHVYHARKMVADWERRAAEALEETQKMEEAISSIIAQIKGG